MFRHLSALHSVLLVLVLALNGCNFKGTSLADPERLRQQYDALLLENRQLKEQLTRWRQRWAPSLPQSGS